MKLRQIYAAIDAAYPKKLSDEYVSAYGGHDNSGILVDTGEEISRALFSLDLSLGAIARAKESGCRLIVTHHPAVFYPVSNILADDPVGKRLIACIREGISVISMHLNLDCAPLGIDDWLCRGLGGRQEKIFEPLSSGGYGRVCSIAPCSLAEFSERVKKEFCTSRALVYGTEGKISRAASFCGAGVDGSAIAHAKQEGADVILSSDVKHNHICDILESGMKLVSIPHYASENYGFKKIYQDLSGKLGVSSEYYEDAFML